MSDEIYFPEKDPDSIEPFFFVWCSEDGTNDGSAEDMGELQGATISSYEITVPSGITNVSAAKTAVTLSGVTYAINTVVSVWLSGGTAGQDYNVACKIATSDGRTLEVTRILPVRTL
jgi:hypothetical protein